MGCRKDVMINAIDSNINIKMLETVDSTKRTLKLYCSTEKEYNCSNFGIINTINQPSNKIEIDFNGITVPDFCLTSLGPARTTIDIGTLSNGTYDLDIKVENEKSAGQLIVTSEYYKINLDPQKQLQITYPTLNRIPTNTVWGTVGYHSSNSANLVQTFIDSLQLLGTTIQTYQSGEYGYFQINPSGQILPPQNHGYYFIRPYIFNYSGSTSALKKLVKNYGTNYGNSLNIILYTTKGETFRSWTQ